MATTSLHPKSHRHSPSTSFHSSMMRRHRHQAAYRVVATPGNKRVKVRRQSTGMRVAAVVVVICVFVRKRTNSGHVAGLGGQNVAADDTTTLAAPLVFQERAADGIPRRRPCRSMG